MWCQLPYTEPVKPRLQPYVTGFRIFPPCISSSLQNCTGSGSTLAFMLIQMTINRAAFRVGPKKRTECKSDVPGKTELVVFTHCFQIQ